MLVNELVTAYEAERKEAPRTMNDLLDYYQKKYIAGEIDIKDYRDVYNFLHQQGATSAHEYM
ncbi:YppF-like protein [Oceanobacillus limi]|uniref:YppF-like protein n=1 Tax=Oceanobacillus limi TaxID=930131 RepID=A0A1I0C4X6_9BACI|nr:YppF family protein [Oceanobacillus limi]SET14503.1 YppF-like protein [Oceanobacillus limi]